MKKDMAILFIMLVSFIGCELEETDLVLSPHDASFEDVSAPYLEEYGSPESISGYSSTGYHSIDWWWWSRGVMVCFVTTSNDGVYGWYVNYTYSFDSM